MKVKSVEDYFKESKWTKVLTFELILFSKE